MFVGLLCLALGWIWLFSGGVRQDRVGKTILLSVLTPLLIYLWFMTISGFRIREKIVGTAAVALMAAVGFSLFRITGVDGDMVPIVSWRWDTPSQTPQRGGGTLRTEGVSEAVAFPQFLGRFRNATIPGVDLEPDWESHPPREVWRRPVGEGWAGMAVVGNLVVTQEQQGDQEQVVAYDLGSGDRLWVHSDPARYSTVVGGTGPRSTPTIDGGMVFTIGGTGLLNALDLATGEQVWEVNVLQEAEVEGPTWGYSASPLVLGSSVIVPAGGKGRLLVAHHRRDGRLLWADGTGKAGHASPMLAKLAGVEQIISFNSSNLTAHDPSTGAVLWKRPWRGQQPNVMQPIALGGDRLLFSSGYGKGSKMFRVVTQGGGKLQAELVWESIRLKSKFANAVVFQDHVYGLDDGIMVCLDPDTGERKWKRGRYGHGQLLLVGDLILLQTEQGEIVLIQPAPERLNELARFEVFPRKTWNSPTLAGRYLLVRNDREAVCLELPLRDAPPVSARLSRPQ